MSVALRLYERLTEAEDDRTRAKLIAEAIEQVEERFPHLQNLATQGHVRESELKLQKEIEGVRLEIREAEGRLQKEIEGVRLEIREVEGRLQKEIEGVRLEIRESENHMIRWMVGMGFAVFSGMAGLIYWLMERMAALLG